MAACAHSNSLRTKLNVAKARLPAYPPYQSKMYTCISAAQSGTSQGRAWPVQSCASPRARATKTAPGAGPGAPPVSQAHARGHDQDCAGLRIMPLYTGAQSKTGDDVFTAPPLRSLSVLWQERHRQAARLPGLKAPGPQCGPVHNQSMLPGVHVPRVLYACTGALAPRPGSKFHIGCLLSAY